MAQAPGPATDRRDGLCNGRKEGASTVALRGRNVLAVDALQRQMRQPVDGVEAPPGQPHHKGLALVNVQLRQAPGALQHVNVAEAVKVRVLEADLCHARQPPVQLCPQRREGVAGGEANGERGDGRRPRSKGGVGWGA